MRIEEQTGKRSASVSPAGAVFERHSPACRREPAAIRGFTLIEMAVVLVVVSLVLGSLLVPLASQVEQRKIEGTEQILEQAREAVLAFAAARGRLPCPAGTDGGQESFVSGGSAADGRCATLLGFLPAATLGLSPLDADGYARDGWGMEQNRIRYAVRSAMSEVFTKTGGIKAAGMAAINTFVDANALLYVCNAGTGVSASGCGTAFTLTSEGVAVIWSVGPNAATGGVNVHECENPNPNPICSDPTARVLVSRPRSSVATTEFDDQVVWITPPLLFQRMIAAGQLP